MKAESSATVVQALKLLELATTNYQDGKYPSIDVDQTWYINQLRLVGVRVIAKGEYDASDCYARLLSIGVGHVGIKGSVDPEEYLTHVRSSLDALQGSAIL